MKSLYNVKNGNLIKHADGFHDIRLYDADFMVIDGEQEYIIFNNGKRRDWKFTKYMREKILRDGE